MKNVLILASGDMAQHFVAWIGKSRIDTNQYFIACLGGQKENTPSSDNISYIDADPTSYMRVKTIMDNKNFDTIFVVMSDRKEAEYAYKNIRLITVKSFVVFVSNWDDITFNDDYLKVINVNEIMASNLYEKLPNVPLIAKNIGLGKGEIMEILVPFGSSFAYRHVGAISHRKWKIVALYRKEKQIFVNNTTMIQPNDRLIVIGNPMVLEEVYKRVKRRQGVFPEPFGKNLYLIVNLEQKKEDILLQINEAIFLSNQLIKTKLFIRLIHINRIEIIKEIRALQTENIELLVSYKNSEIFQEIDFDISQYDIGLFIMENSQFCIPTYRKYISSLKRAVYIFGDQSLYNIKQALILMGNEIEMESLSASVFDFSESLGLELTLCDYNPEGDFEENQKIVEHYETISRLYNFKINIERKRANPIRELRKHEAILHIIPFTDELKKFSIFNIFSTKLSNYFMSIKKHPQLLIPVDG